MIPFTRLGLQQMQMLGAGAPTAGLPRFITDLFNLLQSSPTYTGGPLTATDYEGNLVTSPAGVPALEGGRLATTVAEGAQLGPELATCGTFDIDVSVLPYIARGTMAHVDASAVLETTSTFSTQHGVVVATADPIITTAGAYLVSIQLVGWSVANAPHRLKIAASAGQNSTLGAFFEATGVGVFSSELAAAAGDCITIQSFGGTATVGDKFTIDNISVREVIPTWYDTELDGTPIQPSISIPTRSGTKQWYQEPFANPFGYSNWPARTNHLINSQWGGAIAGTPGTAPTSWSINSTGGSIDSVAGGDIGATVMVISSDGARNYIIQTTPTLSANTSYLFWVQLEATSGLALFQLLECVSLPAGSTRNYWVNGVDVGVLGSVTPVGGDRIGVIITIAGTGGPVGLRVGIGTQGNSTGSASFTRPQLEAGAFASPYIPTTTTTVTRAATNLTNPLTLAPQLQLVVIPAATGTAGTMLDDGTNKLSYNGTNLIFTDGVTTLSAAATLTAGTAYTIGVKGLAGDWALSVNGTDIDTDTGSLVVWGTAKLGRNDADGDYFAGYFPNVAGYVGTDVNWYKTTIGA
jgi:hypothetical protein